jgi:hypothetical protein
MSPVRTQFIHIYSTLVGTGIKVIYALIHTNIQYIFVHTRARVSVFIQTYTCIHAHIYTYIHTCIYTHMHSHYLRTYIHKCIHT